MQLTQFKTKQNREGQIKLLCEPARPSSPIDPVPGPGRAFTARAPERPWGPHLPQVSLVPSCLLPLPGRVRGEGCLGVHGAVQRRPAVGALRKFARRSCRGTDPETGWAMHGDRAWLGPLQGGPTNCGAGTVLGAGRQQGGPEARPCPGRADRNVSARPARQRQVDTQTLCQGRWAL